MCPTPHSATRYSRGSNVCLNISLSTPSPPSNLSSLSISAPPNPPNASPRPKLAVLVWGAKRRWMATLSEWEKKGVRSFENSRFAAAVRPHSLTPPSGLRPGWPEERRRGQRALEQRGWTGAKPDPDTTRAF
ncbi:hypothetical protein DPEC_G00227170 [Dallia pectoralis]|uniref:Uncharacterized protein n=1 Tax=Dallia pectoralis TaxID=75939 RepID=A0ACC2G0T2_DALPE|nr:hypothetical protein DPEC_G00227170 [Dallia pectoralis]